MTLAASNNANCNNNIAVSIRPATLIQLHKLGFKVVALSSKNIVVTAWTPIYENPNYWTVERLANPEEYSKFVNVATVFGKTHIKDEQGVELYLNGFDCDSEYIYKILTTPVEQLSLPNRLLHSKIQNLLSKTGANLLVEYLKLVTCVVKTRKPYGVHAYWLSHKQNSHIRTEDCRSGYEFEIKTDKGSGHSTLPPSTHRADPKFRYMHLGPPDRIEINDELYDILIELFQDCLISANGNGVNSCVINANRNRDNKTAKDDSEELREDFSSTGQSQEQQQDRSITLYDLSHEMIATSVAYLQPYYIEHHRNNLTMALSGTAWYARISKESTTKIISKICINTDDEETNSRLTTVHDTYENALTANKKITGGPTLAEVIANIKNCDLSKANQYVDRLKTFWHDDIKVQRTSEQQVAKDSGKILSVAEALRIMKGPVNVSGKIVGISGVQAMISGIQFECSSCSYRGEPLIFKSKPVWKTRIKERSKCPSCDPTEGNSQTLLATFEYIPAVEIQLQDTKRVNDIEQLNALLFSQDTENIPLNEVVTLKGNMHVVRKNDNPSNKLTPFLYVESLDRENKEEEIKLTDSGAKQIKEFAISHEETLIDDLVAITAPLIVGNEFAKRAALIVAVNAGLPNDKNRLPQRIRSHAGFIGDPSQAKSLFLRGIAELVPGSRVESAQSGTGISMTVYIEKDEGGQRIIRPGPVVLSSGSILGLNEFGQMRNIEDHKYFTDAAEEGEFTVTKHGFNVHIEAHPSIIFTANPISGFWKNPDRIDPAEFPILTQMGERIDFLIPFIEKTDEASIREYTKKRRELAKRLGTFAADTLWLKKYLLYARNLNPDIPDYVRIKLVDFLIEMAKQGIKGLPRKLDALERTAIGFAKLKLKDVVDEEDAYDTMALFNDILKFYKQDVETQNPRDITFNQCLKILQASQWGWRLDDLIVKACQEDPSIESYIGDHKKAEFNSKIKAIKPLLDKHPSIQRVGIKPTIYRWIGDDDKSISNTNGDYTNNNVATSTTQTNDAHSLTKNCREILDKSKDVSDVSDTQITLQAENFHDYSITANADIKYSNPQDISNNLKSDHHHPLSEQVNEITEKLTSEIKKDTSDISNTSANNNKKVIEDQQNILKIRHSESAHILTNDDVLAEEEREEDKEDDK